MTGSGDFMEAPAFEATTASKEKQLYEPDPPSTEDPTHLLTFDVFYIQAKLEP